MTMSFCYVEALQRIDFCEQRYTVNNKKRFPHQINLDEKYARITLFNQFFLLIMSKFRHSIRLF